MANTIFSNCVNDRQYKAATGLSLVEFNDLFAFFAPCYVPKQANPYYAEKAPLLTDKREALFFILHYYKAYPTFQNMGLYFGMSNAAACQYVELLRPCLHAALTGHQPAVKRLFTNQAEFDKLFEGVGAIFIDVTEIPIERADNYDVQKLSFSGKKRFHTLKWLLICDCYKRILFASKAYDGRTHDFAIFKEIFAGLDFSRFETHVDLGFLGLGKNVSGANVFIPHKATKNYPLTARQKEENTELSRLRVVVENAIAKIKSFFIMRIENRMKIKNKLNDAFHICAALANFKSRAQSVDC